MSEIIRFHCHTCGNDFDLYEKNVREGMNIVCPHCCAEIPPTQANRCIAALLVLKNANYHFRKLSEDSGNDLFTASIEGVYVPNETIRSKHKTAQTSLDPKPELKWQ
jgi:DNA-directed RNA polymerase subunit RPC12/RpoP